MAPTDFAYSGRFFSNNTFPFFSSESAERVQEAEEGTKGGGAATPTQVKPRLAAWFSTVIAGAK